MKISKKAQYGLRAMVFLAKKAKSSQKKQKAFSIREISNIEGMPFEFLSKIFMDLERKGLVKAKFGANGGYVLAKPPQKITVLDIVGSLENINAVNCRLCPKLKKCLTKNVWAKLDEVVDRELKKITLAKIIT